MKKITALKSALVFLGLNITPILTFASPLGLAPTTTTITIECPSTKSGTPNILTNFGEYVAGYGTENILNTKRPIYFISTAAYTKTMDLIGYTNSSATYDSTHGRVACNYANTDTSLPVITVMYNITNGLGGDLITQTANSVSIVMPIGSK